MIQEELKFFLQVLKETNEKPFDIKEQLTQGVNNIITSIVFGQRCNYSDEHLANLQITEFRDIFEKTKYMPILRVSNRLTIIIKVIKKFLSGLWGKLMRHGCIIQYGALKIHNKYLERGIKSTSYVHLRCIKIAKILN